VLQQWRRIPTLRFIADYYDFPDYIQALATHIQADWAERAPPDKLLFSFHGLPQRFATAGDPYPEQCYATAEQIARQLKLSEAQWQVVFQSRFGREAWLQPYTDHTLIALAQAGIKHVDVVCPGFAADCLETLEEINQENRGRFLQVGGQVFHYISALNDSDLHITALFNLIKAHIDLRV
jgi:ferrochelatase